MTIADLIRGIQQGSPENVLPVLLILKIEILRTIEIVISTLEFLCSPAVAVADGSDETKVVPKKFPGTPDGCLIGLGKRSGSFFLGRPIVGQEFTVLDFVGLGGAL